MDAVLSQHCWWRIDCLAHDEVVDVKYDTEIKLTRYSLYRLSPLRGSSSHSLIIDTGPVACT